MFDYILSTAVYGHLATCGIASPPALTNYQRDALARLGPNQVSLCASWKFQTQHGERTALQQVLSQTLQAATLNIRA